MFRGYEIEDGLHGRCKKQVSDAEAERLRETAREVDREQWRLDHPS
jgi:hypothetical protein